MRTQSLLSTIDTINSQTNNQHVLYTTLLLSSVGDHTYDFYFTIFNAEHLLTI
jgi:hypothetical protein